MRTTPQERPPETLARAVFEADAIRMLDHQQGEGVPEEAAPRNRRLLWGGRGRRVRRRDWLGEHERGGVTSRGDFGAGRDDSGVKSPRNARGTSGRFGAGESTRQTGSRAAMATRVLRRCGSSTGQYASRAPRLGAP